MTSGIESNRRRDQETPNGGINARLRRLLAPTERPETGREPIGAVSRIMQWWGESDEGGRRAIENAVVAALARLARSRKPFEDSANARLLLLLAQLVAELRLDDRARTLLWSIAQLGRASSEEAPLLPPEVEARLLAWLAVIQVREWEPLWLRLWRSQHADLWPVALSAIINLNPTVAAAAIPRLLERQPQLGADRCAYLLDRILQYEVPWPEVVAQWREALASQGCGDLSSIQQEIKRLFAEPGTRPSSRAASGLRKLKEALASHVQRALELKTQAGDVREQGVTLHEMGLLRAKQGKHEEARELFERALALKAQAGDVREQGVTLHQMGLLRAKQGKHDEAWELFERALALETQVGDVRGQGVTLHEMGLLRLSQEKPELAMELFERGLQLAGVLGDPEAETHHRAGLESAREALGQTGKSQRNSAQ